MTHPHLTAIGLKARANRASRGNHVNDHGYGMN